MGVKYDRKNVASGHCVIVHAKLVRTPIVSGSPLNAFNVDNTRVNDAIEWCKAAPYDSVYAFDNQTTPITETRFRFSNPNVALEFKMRFGGI